MHKDYINSLAYYGFINSENLFAEATESSGKFEPGVLCVNESKVSFVTDDPPEAQFETTTDKMSQIEVKNSGLFKKALSFVADGEKYTFVVKGGKAMLKFFEIVEQYHLVRKEQQKDLPNLQAAIDDIIEKNHNGWDD